MFQSQTFRFGHHTPDKQGGDDAYHTVEAVGEAGTELVQRRERRGYQIVEYPLEGNGDGNGLAAYRIGENL